MRMIDADAEIGKTNQEEITQEDVIKRLSAIKSAHEATIADNTLNLSDKEAVDWINATDLCELCAYEHKDLCEKEPCVNGELKWVQPEPQRRIII